MLEFLCWFFLLDVRLFIVQTSQILITLFINMFFNMFASDFVVLISKIEWRRRMYERVRYVKFVALPRSEMLSIIRIRHFELSSWRRSTSGYTPTPELCPRRGPKRGRSLVPSVPLSSAKQREQILKFSPAGGQSPSGMHSRPEVCSNTRSERPKPLAHSSLVLY